MLDYDPASSRVSTECLDRLSALIEQERLTIHSHLETHAHADHLSGAQDFKRRFPEARLAIGARITEVQSVFQKLYHLPESFRPDGSQFDVLLQDGETLHAGSLPIEVIFTPGHTPACVSYRMGDAVFTGDALMMPDTGTGRCDFPAGSSRNLHGSIVSRLYALPDETRVFVGHDYKANGTRPARWESTIREQKRDNIHVRPDTSVESYCSMRDARDAKLSTPRLLLPSLQVNIDGGRLPTPESNGVSYLKIPIRPKP